MDLSPEQRWALGLDASQLHTLEGHQLHPAAADAFRELAADAQEVGFALTIASAYRSFERQLAIWNGKLSGQREVLDDRDDVIDLSSLAPLEQIERVLRFSALPGASRHHWGTDIDVYDKQALAAGERLRLCQAEVADDGPFAALHEWLDERIATGRSYGFYRPYDRDRGGVSPERWHLSHGPSASTFAPLIDRRVLCALWTEVDATSPLLLREIVEDALDELLERFVARVGTPP